MQESALPGPAGRLLQLLQAGHEAGSIRPEAVGLQEHSTGFGGAAGVRARRRLSPDPQDFACSRPWQRALASLDLQTFDTRHPMLKATVATSHSNPWSKVPSLIALVADVSHNGGGSAFATLKVRRAERTASRMQALICFTIICISFTYVGVTGEQQQRYCFPRSSTDTDQRFHIR